MINIILIFLIILLFLIIQTESFINIDEDIEDIEDIEDDNEQLLNDTKIENDFNCYIYGCNSSRNDMIEWIGTDENKNEIFKNENKDLFIFNNGFLNKVDNINFSKIKKYTNSLSIPTIITDDNKTQLKINLKYKDYTFCGYLTNNFYRLQFLVYKKPITTEIQNDKLYEYIVVKIINNEYKIMHKLPLRQNIQNLETLWINYGPISLGPLIFTVKINFF
jgi:hypothetical protein